MALRIGIDIGGTFTDLVALDEATGSVVDTKALSTPQDLLQGILRCVDQAGARLDDCRLAIHGTTIGINALLEHKGARTGLVTTEGFRDVLEIGRGNFLRMYDVLYRRPTPLVPRGRRLEVGERVTARGEILAPLDEAAVRAAARQLAADGVESVAVCFLFSFRNPEHERRAAEILAEMLPGVSISVSHRITQEWREYERTSTTVVNAYVRPIMDRYLGAFERGLAGRGFRGQLLITQSNGGAFSVQAAASKPVHTIESGPAAGAIGCASLAQALGADRLISFDMGGTTAKCAIVAGGLVQTTDEYHVDGHPLRIPVIDITEVSAGGGTIAWIDAGGALALGPQSAGADPGPVCYGRGGAEPTVTDANLVLGRIAAGRFLGGTMPLDQPAAARAIEERLGLPLGLARDSAAAGVVRLADVKMALAVRSITTERGLDPRDYTLVAYGGGGPLHAVAIARELGIPRVIIPPAPSTFSAWGMLATDLRHDLVRTVLEPLERTDGGVGGGALPGDGDRDRGHPAAGGHRGPPPGGGSALPRAGAHRDRRDRPPRGLGVAARPVRRGPPARLRLRRAGRGGAAAEPAPGGGLPARARAAARASARDAAARPPSRRARSTPRCSATCSSTACTGATGCGPAT